MYNEWNEVAGFSGQLGYVDTCPNQPEPGKAICEMHCQEAMKQNIPTELWKFKASHQPCKWIIADFQLTIIIVSKP